MWPGWWRGDGLVLEWGASHLVTVQQVWVALDSVQSHHMMQSYSSNPATPPAPPRPAPAVWADLLLLLYQVVQWTEAWVTEL